jgi:hypothetical protein
MSCSNEENSTSTKIEAQIDSQGHFKIREYIYVTSECSGVAVDLRTRYGHAEVLEDYSDGSQKVSVILDSPFSDGDLMSAEAIVSLVDDTLTIRPIQAVYFGVGEKKIRVWEGEPQDVHALVRITTR